MFNSRIKNFTAGFAEGHGEDGGNSDKTGWEIEESLAQREKALATD